MSTMTIKDTVQRLIAAADAVASALELGETPTDSERGELMDATSAVEKALKEETAL